MTWIVWGTLGFIALLVGIAALVIVLGILAVRIEKRQVVRLVSIPDAEGPSSRGGKAAEIAREADDMGLLYLGAFRDDESSLLKARIDLFLSEDGVTTLLIPPMARALGYQLISRMEDGVWLFTGSGGAKPDLSGFELSSQLPKCPMPLVMRYHLDRVADYQSPPVPFEPGTLVQDMFDHHHAVALRLVEQGYATWVSPVRKQFRMTWRGAVLGLVRGVGGAEDWEREEERAKDYKQEAGLP